MAHPQREVQPAEPVLLPVLARLPGHLVWRAHARVVAAMAQTLPDGVDIHAYGVLLALADGPPRSQQSLAETTKVSRTTMAKVAADLAGRGLVERVRNPEDRRSFSLTRTAAGAEASRSWEQHVADYERAVGGPLDVADGDELRALLLAIVRAEIPDDAPDELVAGLGFLITRLHFRMHRDFLAGLEPLGLEPRQFGSLVALTDLGPVPQAELARRLGVSAPSIVQVVDGLEERGLVRRRRLASDRRTHALHLTPDAGPLLARATVVAAATVDARLAGLDDAQRARLVELLQRFVTA